MSCCTASPVFPSSPTTSSYISALSSPAADTNSATPLTLTDFTTLVSAALAFNPIFEPLSLPRRPESACFSSQFQDNARPMKPEEKLTMLKKIKSVLLREPQPSRSFNPTSDLPKLPLPPPTDPLFTPHIPLPLALERGLVNYDDEDDEPVSPSSSTVSGDCESCQVSCSLDFSPLVGTQLPLSSTSSEGSSSYLESHASSSVDLTSDPSDPFAKGHVQVVRRSTGSSSSVSSYGSGCLGPYGLDQHPYATAHRKKSPSKKTRQKFIAEAPLPPPSCPLPLPPKVPLLGPQTSVLGTRIHSESPPLPPRLPMPTRPLPPPPAEASRNQLIPRSPITDWTLDLPLEETAFDSFRVVYTEVDGEMANTKRRKVGEKVWTARRTSLQKAAMTSRLSDRKHDSLSGELRPGHRRKGSPFPLLFESPSALVASPLSTPTGPTFPREGTGSPQKSRKSRPPSLAHTLVLSSTGLPISPFPLPGPDVPVTPTSTESEVSLPTTPPSGGRANVPGWFFDDSDISEQGHGKSVEEYGKTDGEERYWTASESVSTHEY